MSSRPSLFDLFDATSLLNLERRLAEGKTPTAEELAAVLEANSAEPLPAWFSALVVKSLRGELKKKRGRPKDENPLSSIYFQFAMAKYHQYLPRLQKTRTLGWAGRMACPARQTLVARTAPRTCSPNGHGALASPHRLAIVFEPHLVFIIIPADLS